MDIEDAWKAVWNILEPLSPELRLRVFRELEAEMCFTCGKDKTAENDFECCEEVEVES